MGLRSAYIVHQSTGHDMNGCHLHPPVAGIRAYAEMDKKAKEGIKTVAEWNISRM